MLKILGSFTSLRQCFSPKWHNAPTEKVVLREILKKGKVILIFKKEKMFFSFSFTNLLKSLILKTYPKNFRQY